MVLGIRFPQRNTVCTSPNVILATCLAHLILLDLITRRIFDEAYRSYSSLLCSLLHFPVTSSLLGPNIFLSTLFSNTLSLCSSLNVTDQVSHPYTTGKITFLCILAFVLLGGNLEDKDSATIESKHSLGSIFS